MTKYTKKQYTADKIATEALLKKTNDYLAYLDEKYSIATYIPEETVESWNAAHDKVYELENELRDIERRWSRRNWTGYDYASHELVIANID